MERIVSMLLIISVCYLSAGLAFAIYFIFKGIYKLDDVAGKSPLTFKLIITPGVIIMWIVLLRKIILQKT